MARAKAFHRLRYAPSFRLFNRKSNVYKHTFTVGVRIQNAAKVRLGRSPKRIDTGRLRASIGVKPFKSAGFPIYGVTVGTNVDYAIYVHDGTRYMEANPFLRDAVISVSR